MQLTTINTLTETLQKGWDNMIESDDGFREKLSSLLRVKEPGHSLAPSVEEKIIEILNKSYNVRVESNRDIADVWVEIENIFIPFNVKTHIKRYTKTGKEKYGQPNICSMRRILEGVSCEKFDYYFIIWVIIEQETENCEIIIDSLSELFIKDALTFNDGPQQIMAKQKFCAKGIERIFPLSSILLELNQFRLDVIKKNREQRDIISNKLTLMVESFCKKNRTPV